MSLTPRLPLLPVDAAVISDDLAIQHSAEQVVFFNAAGPIFSCDVSDTTAVRLGAQIMIEQKLAGVGALAKALGLNRTTLFRDGRRMKQSGISGLGGERRGPKGPRLLTGAKLLEAQDLLDRGASLRSTAVEVGVSDGTVRNAIRQGRLHRESIRSGAASAAAPAPSSELETTGPAARATEDQACEPGIAVKRTVDRALARLGVIEEAPAAFPAAEAVPGAGVLLALPALMHEGLLDIGQKVYGRLRNGYFGLRSVLLTFAFMALLRIRTPEQITGRAPGELGILLGLDRAPEVKTLRRKLAELGQRGRAHVFLKEISEHWMRLVPDELGVLYIDGHVRPYHGRTHRLPKLHVQQRGRPMPATKDFHVNDRRADPLFFVTAPTTEGLIEILETELFPEIRRAVGSERRVTVVFDREGWSPKGFKRWQDEGFDVLTYRKGKQTRWQHRFFEDVEGKVDGRRVAYRLAERRVTLSNGLRVREIRRLTDTGHQTAIITTNEELSTLEAAQRMFRRWRQENFFRYMEQEFDLNHLCTNDVDPADGGRMVKSPERAKLEKERATVRARRVRLIDKRVDLTPGEKARVGKKHMTEDEMDAEICRHEKQIKRLTAKIEALPKRVRLDTVMAPGEIVQLERERKVLTDVIKLTAYRAESALTRLLDPLLARCDDEGRKFLKAAFQATADILPDPVERYLTVRMHGLESPRETTALAGLCARLNEAEVLYPGTDLRLRFEAPTLQK